MRAATLRFYWQAYRRYPRALGLCFLVIPANILSNIVAPFIVATMVNKLAESAEGAAVGDFIPYLLAAAVALGSGALLEKAYMSALTHVQIKTVADLYKRSFEHLGLLDYKFYSNTFAGSLVAKMTRFAKSSISMTDALFMEGLVFLTNFVFAIIVLAFLSWPIALVMCGATLLFLWISVYLSKRREPLRRARAESESLHTALLADSLTNMVTVKTFAAEEHEQTIHDGAADDVAQKTYRSWISATNNGLIMALLAGVLEVAVLAMSITAALDNTLAIGTLLLIQAYLFRILAGLMRVWDIVKNADQAFSDAEEMTQILLTSPGVADVPHPKPFTIGKGKIVFDNVSFQYSDNKHTKLFEQLSLQVKPGEKVGIVGPSGSGKTTLTKLLLRFMDVNAGRITIDGHDISQIAQVELRSNISYVPQEPLLFHRSILENILYARPGATEAEVYAAATKAHGAEFIAQLPQGYDTLVGERGVKLSGGQRQRIAIARAMLKNAPILILDEATSALDSESEQLIQDALSQLMKQRTTLVIAHRLSTIQKMDRIVVLADGRIVEEGPHAKLLRHNGMYARLWKHQSGGFIED